jgi:16S rRNA (guanine1516-N2)-methyltransferase
MSRVIVTTSRDGGYELTERARLWGQRLGAPFVARNDRSLEETVREAGAIGAVVVAAERIFYREPQADLEFFFHPHLARMRLHNILIGHLDPLVMALALQPGDRALDCTLGRGIDAIVIASVVGEGGEVVGLEKVPVLALLAAHGLESYAEATTAVRVAMRRVRVTQADYGDFLPQLPDASFDVVYFDPVFDQPVDTSATMRPLRHLAADDPVTADALAQARRVARRRVVIKQRRDTPLWTELPPDDVIRGRKSRIEYGVFVAG